MFDDFKDFTTFTPQPRQADNVGPLLDQVVAWGTELKSVREAKRGVGAR
jgi:hypothetical protein